MPAPTLPVVKVRLRRVVSTAQTEAVPILIVGLLAFLVAANLGGFFTTDTWLALVSGRELADHGLPATDTLTAWSAGDRWIDQQWLGQLALYGLHTVGGLRLVASTHALLVIAPFAAAVACARRRGASARSTVIIGVLALEPLLIVAGNIRTQSFAFGLFVIVLWLLASDARAPSGRVFWTIPTLVLWSNVHGSAILGVALVILAGLLSLAHALRAGDKRSRSALGRPLLLVALACAALLASPYATQLPSYYESTLLNSQFHTLVSEWGPPSPSLTLLPFFVLCATALVVLGGAGARLAPFERVAIVATIVLALTAYRNLAWFGLAATMLLPAAMGATSASDARPPRPAAAVSAAVGALAVVATLLAVARLDATLRERYPPAALDAVSRAAGAEPAVRVFADLLYADWLLWQQPELAGRLSFDARLELLSAAELRRIARFDLQIGADWRAAAGDARLFVLQAREHPLAGLPATWSVLLGERHARKLYGDTDVAVILAAGRRAPEPRPVP